MGRCPRLSCVPQSHRKPNLRDQPNCCAVLPLSVLDRIRRTALHAHEQKLSQRVKCFAVWTQQDWNTVVCSASQTPWARPGRLHTPLRRPRPLKRLPTRAKAPGYVPGLSMILNGSPTQRETEHSDCALIPSKKRCAQSDALRFSEWLIAWLLFLGHLNKDSLPFSCPRGCVPDAAARCATCCKRLSRSIQ